jgi:hypothetical protein
VQRIILRFGLGLLVLLIALVVTAEFFSHHPRHFTGKIEQCLPSHLVGWTRRDIPVGETGAAAANVQGILNFSQVGQVLYTSGNLQVLVYAAYWEPGKVSVVDAGSHNPDSCWVNNGCVRTERKYAVSAAVEGRQLVPYEYGTYLPPRGAMQHVAFWHLVNGQPNRYEEQAAGWRDGLWGRLERLPLLLKDFREYGLNQKSEQIFIRISSPIPFEELLTKPEFRALLLELEGLGIFTDRPLR